MREIKKLLVPYTNGIDGGKKEYLDLSEIVNEAVREVKLEISNNC